MREPMVASAALAPLAAPFESEGKRVHAARLGMWVFVASEILFFSGLFALYTTCRLEHARGFGEGVSRDAIAWASVNTGVLLASSCTIALAVHELRRGGPRVSAL